MSAPLSTRPGLAGPFLLHPNAASLPHWAPAFVEIASLVVVALAAWTWRKDRRMRRAFVVLMLAGLLGETVAMALYGYYAYAPTWRLWLGAVPAAVVGVWPVVVLMSWRIAAGILGPGRRPLGTALATAALVVFDAAFIEPVAVRMGLWAWRDGSYFGVPILGFFGWGFLGFAAVWVMERPGLAHLVGLGPEEPARARPPGLANLVAVGAGLLLAVLSVVCICHALLAPVAFSAMAWGPTLSLGPEGYAHPTLGLGLLLGLAGVPLGRRSATTLWDIRLMILGSGIFFGAVYLFDLSPFTWSLATWPLLYWTLTLVPCARPAARQDTPGTHPAA